MNDYRRREVRARCYRDQSRVLQIVGGVLIAIGLLLLFLCIPGWAWAALAGVVLVVGGALLIRLSNRR